jgi:hypothetical protein
MIRGKEVAVLMLIQVAANEMARQYINGNLTQDAERPTRKPLRLA